MALRVVAISIALLFLAPTSALADHLANVFFPGVKKVQSASGIIYTTGRSLETSAKWTYDSARGGVVLSIIVPKHLTPSETLVSGVIVDESGHLNFSPLSYVDLSNPRTVVPHCGQDSLPRVFPEQEGPFRRLVEIRQSRVDVVREKLKQTINPELFGRLQKLEAGFDLEYQTPLSLDLPIDELAERLDILFHTVQRYEVYKTRKDTEAALDARLHTAG